MAPAFAQESATDVGEAEAMRCLGLRESDPAAAIVLAERMLPDEAVGVEPRIKLLTCLSWASAISGDVQRAQSAVEQSDALLARHPMPPEFALRALSNSGAAMQLAGRIHAALDYYVRAYEAAHESESDLAQAAMLVNVGSIHSESLGAYDRAEAYFALAEQAQLRGGREDYTLSYNRASNLLRMGQYEAARAMFATAESKSEDSGYGILMERARAERVALDARLDGGAPEQVQRNLLEIAGRQRALQDTSGAAITLVRASEHALTAAQAEAALGHARAAGKLIQGSTFRVEQRYALAAELVALRRLGDDAQALAASERLRALEVSELRGQGLEALAELQARLHNTQSERELQQLRDERQIEALRLQHARRLRNASIAAFIVFALLAGAFILYQRRVTHHLQRLSTVDGLTGLLNRRAASRQLQMAAETTAADERRGVVFLIDIDHFKSRNDRYGHAAGDAVLAEVARHLRGCCRPDDIVARWGGEEFLVGCRGLDLAKASIVAERLRASIADMPRSSMAGDEDLSVSIGFASHPFFPHAQVEGGWQEAITLADRALYAAKHGGRNSWVGLWGRAERSASIESVAQDPERHASLGDLDVVASQQQVHWKPTDT